MSSAVSGAAIYKKKNGLLSIYETADPPMLKWLAADQSVANPKVEIPLRSITNLQASPASSEKLLIRILHFSEPSADGEPVKTVFSFTNKMIMETIKDTLRSIVERQEASKQATKQAHNTQIHITQTKDNLEEILNAKSLLDNLELQQRLLSNEPKLKQIFTEAVIRNNLDPKEFWKTRLHLLGTFALKNKAKKGPYNVLSTINLVASSDNKVDLNVTREKIHSIFEQYPIVRKAYEDIVPRVPEGEFWSRFFASKLFRKLKGDKINKNEKSDQLLDPYLKITDEEITMMDENDKKMKMIEKGEDDVNLDDIDVNSFLDVSKNINDNSTKLGNQPDFTMRFEKNPEMISILRGYNRLSKKLVENFEDEEKYIKAKKRKLMPEQEFLEEKSEKLNILKFDDLEKINKAEFVELKISNPMESNNKLKEDSAPEVLSSKTFISTVNTFKLSFKENSINLKEIYDVADRKAAIDIVNKEILLSLIKTAKQSKQSWQIHKSIERDFKSLNNSISSNQSHLTSSDNLGGNNDSNILFSSTTNSSSQLQTDQVNLNKFKLSRDDIESLRLVHITSEEFLKHFWLHFNSGDPSQAQSTKKLFSSVKRCIKRLFAAVKIIKDKEPDPKRAEELETLAKALVMPITKSLIKAKKEYENAEAVSVLED